MEFHSISSVLFAATTGLVNFGRWRSLISFLSDFLGNVLILSYGAILKIKERAVATNRLRERRRED
jgi:hypothetical protein